MIVLLADEAIGDGFWLNGRENEMVGVGDNDGSSFATIGGVNEFAAIACL